MVKKPEKGLSTRPLNNSQLTSASQPNIKIVNKIGQLTSTNLGSIGHYCYS